MHNGVLVGLLSDNSRILEQIRLYENNTGLLPNKLVGLFVNEVFVWTKEDTEEYDRKHGTTLLEDFWTKDALDRGYIYVVDFAGYANPSKF